MKVVPNPEWETAPYEDIYLKDGVPIPLTEEQKNYLHMLGKFVRYRYEDGRYVEVYPFIQVP